MDIKFKNGDLPTLANVLHNLELNAKKSRFRTRFKNMIMEYYNKTVLSEQKLLIDEYAKINEDGTYKIIDKEKGLLDISEEDALIVNENINELMCEEFIIECNNHNRNMILSISEIMLDGDFTLSGQVSDMYDEWCSEFEKVVEYYTKKEGE